jgi:predicted small metal-binding protein
MMKETMMKEPLKMVQCAPVCGFTIKSHDEKELKKFVIEHAKNAHNARITEREVDSMMKTVA